MDCSFLLPDTLSARGEYELEWSLLNSNIAIDLSDPSCPYKFWILLHTSVPKHVPLMSVISWDVADRVTCDKLLMMSLNCMCQYLMDST